MERENLQMDFILMKELGWTICLTDQIAFKIFQMEISMLVVLELDKSKKAFIHGYKDHFKDMKAISETTKCMAKAN